MPAVMVEGRRIVLTNLDKVLYPQGFTKGELLHYYTGAADLILPNLRDRPISLLRYPDGSSGETWFGKHLPPGLPDWMPTTGSGRDARLLIDDLPSLIWTVNLVAELHVPAWRVSAPGMVDRMIVDLDPGEPATIVDCCRLALWLRERLAAAGLTGFPKASGSKGLHLLVPIPPTPSPRVAAYAKQLAVEAEAALPALAVSVMTKAKRMGKVLLDWSQNQGAKTTVSVYSLRAQSLPTVSAPLLWQEVEACTDPRQLVIVADDLAERRERLGDPLAGLEAAAAPLPPPGRPATRPTSLASSAAAAAASFPRPPIPVALAYPLTALPPEGATSWAFEPKFDGVRLLLIKDEAGQVQVQTRSGRITPGFPDLVAAAAEVLPPATIVDGEGVVWRDHVVDFAAVLQRTSASAATARRTARELPASFAAFDILFLAGQDVRGRTYAERRRLLLNLLGDHGPPLQVVPSTSDRGQAEEWHHSLQQINIEGLVAKRMDGTYPTSAQGARVWGKLRHFETEDAEVLGVTGTADRPQALVLRLPDRSRPVLSSPLSDAVRAQITTALRRLDYPVDAGTERAAGIRYRPLTTELTVEVRAGTTRHAVTVVVRLRHT